MGRLASLLPEYDVVMEMHGVGKITGSPHLRRTAFMVCSSIIQIGNTDDPIYAFMDKKRAEGKHFYVYMVAGAAKLLRIYYARVSERMSSLNHDLKQSA